MSASSKFDLSSSSPDRPLYASGQRGSYAPTASLDRSGSFRENMENPILSSLPSMTRSTSTVTRTDVVNFFQCLRFDPKAMVTDHKLNRIIDFKRLTSLTLGVPVEDSPLVSSKGKLFPSPSAEEARRLKAGLRESCTKARERVKIFNESLSVLNKCFPSIPSRKRSRSDALSNDRPMTLFPGDRSVSGTGVGKTGTQSHCSTSGYEFDQQKSEEKVKTAVPSKRTRTSMADMRLDVRANTPTRPAGNIDRDRELLRFPNGSTIQGENHTPSVAVEGWEKSRMKKKRSGIKPDATGSMMTKPIDGHREPKQGVQPRLPSDSRSRFTDTHGFRPGVAPGGVGKADGATQPVTLGIRSSLSKVDQDNHPHLPDRRDRPLGSDKERLNLRTVNNTMKAAAREEFTSPSPTSSTKLNSATRAPRSGSGIAPKLSPPVQRAAAANDWEISHCTNKLPSAVGAGNRKRNPSTRSSSPPVAQWASQRPQKISRPARRNNFPIVPNNDEISTLDSTSDVLHHERRLSSSSPQQKLKSDLFSPTVSETEELGAAEIKSKDKSKRSDEVDEKPGNVQKMSTLLLPPRKNKVVGGEDFGDGIHRQGRSGRGFTSARSLMPLMAEKLGNVGTAKQLRTSRHSLDKRESKGGRPPTRKLSDRKAYKRQKHAMMDAAADFLVGSDDGHEELLAAASAVANTAQTLSSSFWKQMEPLFRFISEIDTAFLRQQVNQETDLAAAASVPFEADASSLISGFGLNEAGGQTNETESFDLTSEHVVSGKGKPKGISLYQRMMAAIVPDELYCNGKEDLNSNVYRSGFELEIDSESDTSCAQMLYSSDASQYCTSNGYRINANGCSIDNLDYIKADNVASALEVGNFSSYDQSQNGLLSEHRTMPGFVCSEYQYNEMSIDERLLLEIHYIGIYPDLESDLADTGNEEISAEINKLNEQHEEMVSKKKMMLGKLLNSSTEMRELQEKEFEQRALDKLVAMAYEKYMSCWGPNAHGMKSASGKMAKQAALAFVKRTLHRCQEFEESRKSCFSEPLYKDMFLSGISRLSDGQTDSNTDGEAGKSYISTSGCSGEARVSAMGAQQSPSLNQDISFEANLPSEVSRVKRRELDDVLGSTIGVSSGIGGSLLSSAKGKRSERDREGKGNGREALSRNGTTKIGRPASSNVKGERKPKTKAKQKTAQLSTSVNGLFGRMSEPKLPGSSIGKSSGISATGTGNDKTDCDLEELEDPIDLSGLQLPEMDVLGVPDDLGGQGQDIGSWLNIDDDGLQDNDFLGLEIPMDDLSELNMMV
ncbi:uncharacterized protein LOC132640851 isoform X1 [Lycium barbarum]|uniref:uncharacterized protein LOC132640851 isoform X1 n=1 Tax=Lycium barbarum TaxID=112863 RepID=UPI00293E9AA0|nr:uncharacterized protein LOC132640851 isoform X1 [Lycium barbarum]XP_060213623.1 uncharacterized protein LOC132640851 isoform X1 [Lycium barbarum]XP_060213624.1 uncharacterized protein LOC132640851 isoform X1 [Lycium barbarum]